MLPSDPIAEARRSNFQFDRRGRRGGLAILRIANFVHLFGDANAPMFSKSWFYLHKSNAANERMADGLPFGRVSPWRDKSSLLLAF